MRASVRETKHYYPRRRLSQAFVAAVRASGLSRVKICGLIGLPARHRLIAMLRREAFPASPKTLARMDALAVVVGYQGEVLR